MRLYLLLNAEKVNIFVSNSLHATSSGMPMLECAISFQAENRIINFSGTDIRLKNDNIWGCLCMHKSS